MCSGPPQSNPSSGRSPPPDPGELHSTVPSGEPPAAGSSGAPPPPARPAGRDLPPGTRVAAYTLREVIGRGGMGVVYVAEQDIPRRTVALKLVRPGLTSPALLERFAYEVQILGRLQHPGIAQIYAAGTVDAGDGPQPYFAMELVRGRPLSAYITDPRVGVRARLELVVRICAAVQHAHTKGVIHRDLKPANILVGDDGQPKVLDFGVARATDGDLAVQTLHTTVGQLIGTVPYMSPEQIGGDPRELDTRSDVYALGVILYELLAGRLPYDLSHKPLPEVARVIREEPPASLTLTGRQVPADLALIVRHALEKDRAQRYQTAGELAADLERFLNDEPILARPPSPWYQLAKFARRNRALVAAGIGLLLVIVAGLVTTATLLARALSAEALASQRLSEVETARQAEETQRKRAEAESVRARREADTAAAVNRFLNNMLASVNPAVGDREITVREVLDEAARTVHEALADTPLVEAHVRTTIGRSYRGLGLTEPAAAQIQAALALRTQAAGEDAPETLESLNDVASIRQDQARYAEAEELFRAALARYTRVWGPDHGETLAVHNNLGLLLVIQGRYAEAEPHLRAALEGHRRLSGPDAVFTLDAMSNLASLLQFEGKFAEAEPLARESLATRRRVFGPRHPNTLAAVINLGTLLAQQSKLAEAEPLYVESLELSRAVLGPEHPDTLLALANRAGLLRDLHRYAEAEQLYREALALRRRVLGPDHADTIDTLRGLGLTLRDLGRLDEAERTLRECYEAARRALGPEHPDTAATGWSLGVVLLEANRAAEAEPVLREACTAAQRVQGPEAWKPALYCLSLAEALAALDRGTEALPLAEAAAQRLQARFGPNDRDARRAAALVERLRSVPSTTSAPAAP